MVLCEVVVQCVMGCGCDGFGVGVWVRAEEVLPCGGLGCGPGCCESVLFRSAFVVC